MVELPKVPPLRTPEDLSRFLQETERFFIDLFANLNAAPGEDGNIPFNDEGFWGTDQDFNYDSAEKSLSVNAIQYNIDPTIPTEAEGSA